MEGGAELLHEFFVGDGVGGSDDVDALHGGVAPPKGAEDDVAEVGDVDPGDEMAAGGGVAAEEAFGEAGEGGEDSAGKFWIAQDEGDAENDGAEVGEVGVGEGFFPGRADVGGEAGADGGILVEKFIVGVAENMGGAGLEPDLRRIGDHAPGPGEGLGG